MGEHALHSFILPFARCVQCVGVSCVLHVFSVLPCLALFRSGTHTMLSPCPHLLPRCPCDVCDADNCPLTPNADQLNNDAAGGDTQGDECGEFHAAFGPSGPSVGRSLVDTFGSCAGALLPCCALACLCACASMCAASLRKGVEMPELSE